MVENELSFTYAQRHGVVIQSVSDNAIKIAHRDKLTPATLIELQRQFKLPLELEQVDTDRFEHLLTQTYQASGSAAEQMAADIGDEIDLSQMMEELPTTEDLLESDDDAPIIRLLNALLSEAIKQQASDIHFETFEETVLVRFRVDGILREVLRPQRVLAPLLVSRIKVMAKLDIAEKRLPQDGRITLRIAGRAVDVRVSTMPSAHGERVVLRLLDKKSAHLNLADLGMGEEALKHLKDLICLPHGIILVTGPTGSGKTTTLYAALTELNSVSRNILTVEDPIEYYLSGIGQTQVNAKVDMTFARGLRAILRQDPDVVMVGEIRDLETAEIAVQASLTGHLVLSTLHTNTAIGAVTRLRDMGIESFLLASSLIGVAAQRLVRLLCPQCKEAVPATMRQCGLLEKDTLNPPSIYQAKGCDACDNTGYKGRTGIYELIPIDETMRNMIHEDASEHKLEKVARQSSRSIRYDGFRRVLAGDTSMEEVLRVTSG